MKCGRVALISFHACPLLPPGAGKTGGMNVYVRQLSKHLAAQGVQVDVFTRQHTGAHLEEAVTKEGVQIVHLDGGPPGAGMSRLHSYLPQFLRHLRQIKEERQLDYNLVHSQYWLSGWVGQMLAQAWEVPHVVTFHTLARIKQQARPGEREPPLRARVEAQLMASADMIVAFSPHEQDAMVQLYSAPRERIQVVPCGVDLSLFRAIDPHELPPCLLQEGKHIILFVGRIEPLKGVDLLLRTVAIMECSSSLKVLIIGGDTQEKEVLRLRRLTQELELKDVVSFLGRVEQNELPYYYSAADMSVLPSYYESFGMVALESMACGTPVVATRVGGLTTLVQHGRTGYLVPWRCPEPLANYLETLMFNPALRKAMGQEGRRWAESMGWDMVAQEITQAYASLSRAELTPVVGV